MTGEITATRKRELQRWVDANGHRFERELALTIAAHSELHVPPGPELDVLVRMWRQQPDETRRREMGTADTAAADAGGVEGQRPANSVGDDSDAGDDTSSLDVESVAAVRSTAGQEVGLTADAAAVPAVRSTGSFDENKYRVLGNWLALAESKRDDGKALAARSALRLFYAQDLGLHAVAAAELSMIYGKLQVSARLLRALARREGFRVIRTHGDDTSCTAAVIDARTGQLLGESTFTIEQAQNAGLAGKDNWRNYPDRMLWARASSNAIYDYAPEAALGIVTDEEISETASTLGQPQSRSDDPLVVSDEEIVEGTIEAEEADYWPGETAEQQS